MRFFCTYFDQNFIYQGLALFESLKNHVGHFTLWVLCFDERTFSILNALNLTELRAIHLEDFEATYPALLAVKANRSRIEYYWTTSPLLPLYVLNTQPEVDRIAYLDADLFFYDDAQPVYYEWGNGSIYLIPHRFLPQHREDGERHGGVFNVGLVGFRRDPTGIACLKRWAAQCIDWCYLRFDVPGLMGDQKYLDDWPERYTGVVVSQNQGIGAGAWNMFGYKISQRDGKIYLNNAPLIVLHLNFVELLNSRFLIGASSWPQRLIYRPYATALRRAIRLVRDVAPDFEPHYTSFPLSRLITRLLSGGIVAI